MAEKKRFVAKWEAWRNSGAKSLAILQSVSRRVRTLCVPRVSFITRGISFPVKKTLLRVLFLAEKKRFELLNRF